jgi:protein required for attachment to host cells
MKSETRWVLTADERYAHLYTARPAADGKRWQLERHDSLESRWEDYHEHRRPTMMDGPPTSASTQHSTQSYSEMEQQEESRRFARDIHRWLGEALKKEHDDGEIIVFAASRFLSPLRNELSSLGDRATLHQAELTRLRPAELAKHPAVTEALGHAPK